MGHVKLTPPEAEWIRQTDLSQGQDGVADYKAWGFVKGLASCQDVFLHHFGSHFNHKQPCKPQS